MLSPKVVGKVHKRDQASAHDKVYATLSNSLIQGQIPPGKSIPLRTLAAEMNVSPMPVREAVRRLIAQKALELQPFNKRLRVPSINENRIRQLMLARQWIEPELAYLSARSMTPKLIAKLKETDAKLLEAIDKGDVDGYMACNHAFHFTIYAAAGADLFLDMARTIWLQTGPFMRVVFSRLEHVEVGEDHHQELIKAYERGDADAARQQMTADVREGMDMMLDALRLESIEDEET
jgi:DNA-binding GntR family transcriptional regulator